MLCPKQNRRAILIRFLLLIGLGSSSVAANVAKMDNLQHSVTLRADSPNREIDPRDLGITAEGRRASIVAVTDTSEAPMSVALVMDAGPNQSAVLDREKKLASSLIAEFSDTTTDFIVIRAGYQATNIVTSSVGSIAMSSLQALTAETGKQSQIPVYKAVALAIEELSLRPGIRVLMIIAEGNDSRSGITYKQLRASAQGQHVSVMTVLVADHSARGSKSTLRYGWDLRSLASDTAGVFLDNDRNTFRTLKRLTEAIRSLRLVTFEIDGVPLGRHRMHTSSNSVGRLHAQKDLFIGGFDCEQRCC
jgi:hypothetical protein